MSLGSAGLSLSKVINRRWDTNGSLDFLRGKVRQVKGGDMISMPIRYTYCDVMGLLLDQLLPGWPRVMLTLALQAIATA